MHIAMSTLSESQQKTLAIIPHIASALSILGSCSILRDIYMNRQRKMKQPYYRILLGMSLFDVVCSISICLSTIPMPVDTPGVYGARGNTQTCAASGFFNQFMLGSILYNLVLSVYYTLSGRFKMPDEKFARRYEPYLHWAVVVLTVGVALAGLPLTLYNPATLWCWLAPYPQGCETAWGEHSPDLVCERGYEAWMYRWIFFYGPLWATIICVTVLMGILTFGVMKEEKDAIVKRNKSYDVTSFGEDQYESHRGESEDSNDGVDSRLGGDTDDQNNNDNEHLSGSTNDDTSRNSSCSHHSNEHPKSDLIQTNYTNNHVPPKLHHQNSNTSRHSNRHNNEFIQFNTASEVHDTSRSPLHREESVKLERTKKMFYQALLYVGVFYLTWIIPTVLRLQQLFSRPIPFWVLVMTAWLAPMQGFWNWLVYRHGPCVA